MWIDDCEQIMETDLSKPISYTVLKQPYIDRFGNVYEGRIVETTTYKIDEFGNSVKWITR